VVVNVGWKKGGSMIIMSISPKSFLESRCAKRELLRYWDSSSQRELCGGVQGSVAALRLHAAGGLWIAVKGMEWDLPSPKRVESMGDRGSAIN
jgi:hypothetical protein